MDQILSLCRLCAVMRPCNELKDLKTDQELCVKIVSKLARLNVKVDYTDSILPKNACFLCVNSLECAFYFVTVVEQAQASLSQFLKKQNEEIKQDVKQNNEGNINCQIPENMNVDKVIDEKSHENDSRYDQISNFSNSDESNDATKDEIILDTSQELGHKDVVENINESNNTESEKDNICNVETEKRQEIKQAVSYHNDSTVHCVPEVITEDNVIDEKNHENDSRHDEINIFSPSNESNDTIEYYKVIFNRSQKLDHEVIVKNKNKSNGLTICSDEDNMNAHLYNKNKKNYDVSEDHNITNSKADNSIKHQSLVKKIDLNKKPSRINKDHEKVDDDESTITDLHFESESFGNRETTDKQIYSEDDLCSSQLKETWMDYMWLCYYCGTEFSHINELRNHSMQHHSACNPYKCTDCGRKIARLNMFLQHVRGHKKHLHFSCFCCPMTFSTMGKSRKHRSTHNNSDYICGGCNTGFSSEEEYNKHFGTFFKKKKVNDVKNSVADYTVKDQSLVKKDTFNEKRNLKDVKNSKANHTVKDQSLVKNNELNNKPSRIVEDDDEEDDNESTKTFSHFESETFENIETTDKQTIKGQSLVELLTKPSGTNKDDVIIEDMMSIDDNKSTKMVSHFESVSFENIETTDSEDVLCSSQSKETWMNYLWKCCYCEKHYSHINELINHSMHHHSACNPYQCTDCNRKVSKLNKFLQHVRGHREELHLSCFCCPMTFSTCGQSRKHRSTHNNSDYICGGCNSGFSTEDEYNKHVGTFYKKRNLKSTLIDYKKRNYSCKICGKTYKFVDNLKEHISTHTGSRKKNYTCDICGLSFFHKYVLSDHQKGTHSDYRPFKCDVCDSAFKTKRYLTNHTRTHLQVKNFICNECGKSFREKKLLAGHVSLHSGVLPHACSFCDKRFRSKAYLKRHLRQHTGAKPYSCDICHREFTDRANWHKHMKRKHGVDKSKRKLTPIGLLPVDPETGKVIYPEKDNV